MYSHANTGGSNNDVTMATLDRPPHIPKRPVIKKMQAADDILSPGIEGHTTKMEDLHNADPFDKRNMQKNMQNNMGGKYGY